MTNENLCLFHKHGHCDTCRPYHVKEFCGNNFCETKNCLKRHPKKCKYFQDFKFCKFGVDCSFSHEVLVVESVKENELKARVESLESIVKEKEDCLKDINEKLNSMEEKYSKLENEWKATIY